MRFAGGPAHGMVVPPENEAHEVIEVTVPHVGVFLYSRGLWWEYEGVGDGEPFYGIVGAAFDDVMGWAKEVLRPC